MMIKQKRSGSQVLNPNPKLNLMSQMMINLGRKRMMIRQKRRKRMTKMQVRKKPILMMRMMQARKRKEMLLIKKIRKEVNPKKKKNPLLIRVWKLKKLLVHLTLPDN